MSFKHRSSRTLSPFLLLPTSEPSASIRALCRFVPPLSSLFSSTRSRFLLFLFFFPLSYSLSLSRSPSVLLRCFAAHGFSRAACNSSGDLLRLIELWETRDENARRTSEREIVAYLVARGHRGRVCSFKYWTIVRLVTEKEMDRIRRNCDVLFQFLL